MINKLPRWSLLAATVIGLGAASAAHASSLRITVENNQGAGGLSITPLYLGFHNGSFDAFDVGGTASTGVELIAETGIASTPGTAGTPIDGTTGVAQERLAADPNSFGAVIASQSGPPPIQPGESESILVDIDNALSSGLFLTYLSMVLPSNDHFIGNDDALRLFSDTGVYLGDQVINVTGAQIYDAGTEANGLEGSAFVAGENIFLSPAGEGTIQGGVGLSDELLGVTLASGDMFSSSVIDFTTNPADFDLLTIRIEQINDVAPVPLPASAPLLLAGFGLCGLIARRRKAAA